MGLYEKAQQNIQMGSRSSPKKGEFKIKAVVFDTYGTVCDFYVPIKRRFEQLAHVKDVACDAGAMAIEWRNAYAISSYTQAIGQVEYRPLAEFQRENLLKVLAVHFPTPVSDDEIDDIVTIWDRLDPWPDTVPGLNLIKDLAVIAPLSNGNFMDMVYLSRYAGLPWDIILGSSLSKSYKPHQDIYLKSIKALCMEANEICMVAAHQIDLTYAASFGMQTAFIIRPDEFGGAIKPKYPEPGVNYMSCAEIHPDGDWTYVTNSFVDLAEQIRLT